MSRVITFSQTFPAYHPRKGQPTYFVHALQGSLYTMGVDLSAFIGNPDIWFKNNHWDKTPKHTTIRSGHRWKAGDMFSPRIWSGKPYASKQIIIAPDIQVKRVWDFVIEKDEDYYCFLINDKPYFELNGALHTNSGQLDTLAKNDGLTVQDFLDWFKVHPKGKQGAFSGQIIAWSDTVDY